MFGQVANRYGRARRRSPNERKSVEGQRSLQDITYLKEVRKVDQHVVPCFLLATCHIKAHCNHIQTFPTLCELVLDSKSIKARGSMADYFRKP